MILSLLRFNSHPFSTKYSTDINLAIIGILNVALFPLKKKQQQISPAMAIYNIH